MNDATPATHHSREEFLTARQLAQVLQVSEATVRRLAQKGRIPSVRITPHIIRFHLQAVRDALDGVKRARRNAAEPELDSAQLSFADLL
ncbi:MAG TPA: helix-turn-helix domain-containing protein [Pyrinomonadaceae bacterium]